MLVLYNLRLGLYHSLTNRLAEGLLSAGTILVTRGEVHRAGTSLVLVESRVNQQVEGIKESQQKEELDSHLTGRVENGPGSRVEAHLVEGRGVSVR